MKQVFFLGILLTLSSLFASAQTPCEDRPIYGGVPFLKKGGEKLTVITNCGYVVGYSEKRKNPLWACYHLRKMGAVGTKADNPKRKDNFRADKRTQARVDDEAFNFPVTKMDRGHLAPSYGIGSRYGAEAQDETFFMSNMMPQLWTLNRKTWNWLEATEADVWANGLDEVWIITGPIFKTHQLIAKSGVEIPDAFYKIIIDEDGGQPRAMAFRMEQGTQPTQTFDKFLIKIRDVEKLTGLNFLSALPDVTERKIETATTRVVWKVE